jgi:hypothetical protein
MHDLQQFTGYVIPSVLNTTYKVEPVIRFSLSPEKVNRRLYLGFVPYANAAGAVVCPFVGFVVRWYGARQTLLLENKFAYGHDRGQFGPVDGHTFPDFGLLNLSALSTLGEGYTFNQHPQPFHTGDTLRVSSRFPDSTGALFFVFSASLHPYRLTLPAESVEIEPWFRVGAALNNLGVIAAVSSDERD